MDIGTRLTGISLRSAIGIGFAAVLGGCGGGDSTNVAGPAPQLKPMVVACGQDADRKYSVTLLDSLGGPYSSPAAINNRGQVVGISTKPPYVVRATIWNGAAATDLGLPDETYSGAYSINEAGTVVGVSWNRRGFNRPVSWSGADVTFLQAPAGGGGTAIGINNSGDIVGETAPTPVMGPSSASIWSKGTLATMSPLPGGLVGIAVGINDHGVIVGSAYNATVDQRATMWVDGAAVDLGTLSGPISAAYAINNRGQIVGASDAPYGSGLTTHATLWYNGNISDLGTLGGSFSVANGINNSGQIVGYSSGPDERGRPALWRDATSAPVDLRTLVDESGAGITIEAAIAINDRGQIAARAFLPDGSTRAVVLTPGPCG